VKAETSKPEVFAFRRPKALKGFEILDAEHTSRMWRIFNTGYALAAPGTWQAEALYRGTREVVLPGMVFCTEPGEPHMTTRIYVPGSFHVIVMDESVLRAYLSERDLNATPHWREIAHRMSRALSSELTAVVRAARRQDSPMKLQTLAVQLVDALIPEILDAPRPAANTEGNWHRAAERVRECLHYQTDPTMDLDSLAERTGLTRYQVVRAFKRRYGLSPHAYQLCVRLGQAATLLKEGWSPVDVAMECGFADQSHFTRHFKRMWGITPARYVRGSPSVPIFRPRR
jgi:AraC-like DNA-binding protein